ncbi:MAG TPA: hypothetical protein VMS22_12855 [Candidatus Eisenbacteria bacterium]|nr:hypothetical protein [Candidatus Eisenbacteria bacterium]
MTATRSNGRGRGRRLGCLLLVAAGLLAWPASANETIKAAVGASACTACHVEGFQGYDFLLPKIKAVYGARAIPPAPSGSLGNASDPTIVTAMQKVLRLVPLTPLEECHADVGDAEDALASLTEDSDGDGLRNAEDKCPATPAGAAVDQQGCSHAEVCAAIGATTAARRKSCHKADWRNDEPLMRKKDADCTVVKGETGGPPFRCVPVTAP